MRNYTVTVEKLTDEELMHKACECTFLGTSRQSLLSIYKSEHSPARTQMFWVKIENLPLATATHLLRHHVGSTPFQLTCRPDRKGHNQSVPDKCNEAISLLSAIPNQDDPKEIIEHIAAILIDLRENSDRNTPVSLGLLMNAQALMDMSKLRICLQAQLETRTVFDSIKKAVAKVDPDLAKMMVRKCVYRGGICGEPKCCGFNKGNQFKNEMADYLENFSDKQISDNLNRMRRTVKSEQPKEDPRQTMIDWSEA